MCSKPILVSTVEVEQVIRNEFVETWTAAFKCDNCTVLNIGTVTFQSPYSYPCEAHGIKSYSIEDAAKVELNYSDQVQWLPHNVKSKDYEFVPDHIAAAANEAHKSLSTNNFRSAIIMSRAVVEATAKDKGIVNKGLDKKIDALRDQDLMSKMLCQQAHQIRQFGNDMAHGDFVEAVSEDESSAIVSFMDQVLDEVYEFPGRSLKIEAQIQNRKTSQKARADASSSQSQTTP